MSSSASEHTAWTAPGSNAIAQATYTSVKLALNDLMAKRDIEVFLQGSYANSTNIRADSDVDIVVMTRQTFQGHTKVLGPTARAAWDALPDATYSNDSLRDEVQAALVAYYGSARITPRNKCIQVDKRDGYVDADVVPCIQYRQFTSAFADVRRDYVEGIAIEPLKGGRIINFPKEHIDNGKTKNALCSNLYKPTVRQMKRLRNRAHDEHRLDKDIAPGYLLECMTYNVPDEVFETDDSERLLQVLLWLKHANKNIFMSCDGIHWLFGDDPGNFDAGVAQSIIDAMWDAY